MESCIKKDPIFETIYPPHQELDSKLTYRIGKFSKEKIRSHFIKPGLYDLILEEAEIFDFYLEKDIYHTSLNKGNCEPVWSKNYFKTNLQGRITCNGYHEFNSKFLRSISIAQPSFEDKFNLDKDSVEFYFYEKNVYRNPKKEELDTQNYHYSEPYLYSDKKCEKEPFKGCERVKLQIVDKKNINYTFIGLFKDKKIQPFFYKEEAILLTELSPEEFIKNFQKYNSYEIGSIRFLILILLFFNFIFLFNTATKLFTKINFQINKTTLHIIFLSLSILSYLFIKYYFT
jgi:hypothetical protein